MLAERSAFEGRRVLRALVGLFVMGSSPAPLAAQFAVSPVIVQLPHDPDGADAVLRIDNEGENSIQFRVYAMDFDQDAAGNHLYAESGAAATSCAGRLRFAPDALSVPAGGRGTVQVSLAPGPDAATCWSMLFVEAPSSSQSAVRVNQRIGVKVYGLGAGGSADGALVAADARPVSDSVEVQFRFRNSGEWPVRPSGAVEIRALTGEVVANVPVSGFSVLPAHDRDVTVMIPSEGLAAGRYLAVPVLDFGADFLAGAQVDFRLVD